jgi:hypothetical protein
MICIPINSNLLDIRTPEYSRLLLLKNDWNYC